MPFDESLRLGRLEGHTDAIWSMALVPLRVRDEALLATASADGTVKVWSTEGPSGPALKLSWGYGGTDADGDEGVANEVVAPTSVAVVHSDMRKLAVAYQDAVVKLFDIETGRQLLQLRSDESYGALAVSALWVRGDV
jgi:striatin 1/3/4